MNLIRFKPMFHFRTPLKMGYINETLGKNGLIYQNHFKVINNTKKRLSIHGRCSSVFNFDFKLAFFHLEDHVALSTL